jgi:signal transduction histidine kinase/AmiR/NasT family two-component response regulator
MSQRSRTPSPGPPEPQVGQPFVPTTLLQAAIDRNPDAIAIMDRSLRLIAFNAAWSSTTGLGDAAVGRILTEILGTSLRTAGKNFEKALAGHEVTKTFKSPNDAQLHQVTMSPWRDETGAIGGIISRHAISHNSRHSVEGRERRLKLAMDMAKVFAFEVDFRTGAITYDPSAPEGLEDTSLHSYEATLAHVAEGQREALRNTWERHLVSGEPIVSEIPTTRPGGEIWWQRTIAEAIRDLNGQVVGMVGVSQTIDEQKEAELALIAEKEAAQAADRAKSEFLANMSHEIRTPLTSVIGFAEMLQRPDTGPQEAKTYIERIVAAGQSLLSVVNDVLDYSKLEAGQVELDPQPFEPATCVKSAVDLLTAQAANKGLALDCDIAPDLPASLAADSARIRQVLLNLVGNAVKFTEKGRVGVSARYDVDTGQLRIAISDSGPGLAADVRGRLFQRFSQVDGSISRRHGGTGLGLAICKSLVDLMGGTLGVESQPGAGSTFWFAVPAGPAAPIAKQEITFEDDSVAHPAHILIVDDVAVNRELVRVMLAPFGHSFEEAENGADAVKAALRSRFDLILMDLQMPGMDGLAAARAIRATAEVNQRTPILAFSANVLSQHTEAALAAGMDDHISKPIQVVELLTKVAVWTDPARECRAGEAKIAC